MKTNVFTYLFTALCTVFTLSSCRETDDSKVEFEDWQTRNETYFKQKLIRTALGSYSTIGRITMAW